MSKKPDFELALTLGTEVAALTALRQPIVISMGSFGYFPIEAINSARLAGRVVIYFEGTSKINWVSQDWASRIKRQLKFFSRSPNELVLEDIRHDIDGTCIEICCTVHPDPIPAPMTSKQSVKRPSRSDIPDSF